MSNATPPAGDNDEMNLNIRYRETHTVGADPQMVVPGGDAYILIAPNTTSPDTLTVDVSASRIDAYEVIGVLRDIATHLEHHLGDLHHAPGEQR